MFDLFNVNDEEGLTVYQIENGIVDMTQTGDIFDSEKAINDAFNYASKLKYEKTKEMEEKLDFKQMKLFIRILRMTYCFYKVRIIILDQTIVWLLPAKIWCINFAGKSKHDLKFCCRRLQSDIFKG